MSAALNILIVGGGFSGMCAAIQLRKMGAQVELIEIDADWRSYGAGISINASCLRALQTIGVLNEVMAQGACTDGIDLYTSSGVKIGELPAMRLLGNDVPGSGGIMRPVLARILAHATRESGVNVRLGCTFNSILQSDQAVSVAFTDGSNGVYDLVIGADGLKSKLRDLLFADAPRPRYTGQGVWRAVARRPVNVERPAMYMGTRLKAGINPVSRDEMYLFVTENRPLNEHIPSERLLPDLKSILNDFSAPVIATLRDELSAASQIVYRPLEALLLPRPWSKGRVVLIGDAVHATTPHLAAGAGMGIEDAIVLAEELRAGDTVSHALEGFQQRRWERCRLVVENSVRLGEIEQGKGTQEEHAQIMRACMQTLAAPI